MSSVEAVLGDAWELPRTLVRGAARAARTLRHAIDRRLHPHRRRRALRRVATLEHLSTAVFVCHGNICRSPYAEHRFRAALRGLGHDAPTAGSAGFIGPGRLSPVEVVDHAARVGLDLRAHQSRLLTPALATATDLVVVMEPRQVRAARRLGAETVLVLGDLDPTAIHARAIKDPWGRSVAEHVEVYDRIDRCVELLARTTGAHARPLVSARAHARGGPTPPAG